MKSLIRHIKVFLYLARHSVVRDLEYRLDFLSNLVASVGWINFTLFVILVLGQKTGGFGGWNPHQMLLLSGCWMINNGIAHFFWYRNIKQLISDIHSGSLDFWLTKPVDVQFLTSFRRVIINALVGPLEGVIIVAYALNKLNITPSLEDILKFGALTIVGAVIYYALWFIAATLTIHFTLADNLLTAVPEIVWLSKFPPTAYPQAIFMVFVSVVPILIMTGFPAQQIMGLLNRSGFFYAIAIGFTMLFISRKFWFFSLRHYSSASS